MVQIRKYILRKTLKSHNMRKMRKPTKITREKRKNTHEKKRGKKREKTQPVTLLNSLRGIKSKHKRGKDQMKAY